MQDSYILQTHLLFNSLITSKEQGMPALQDRNTTILSTVVEDINIAVLQNNLDKARDIWIDGYLTQNYAKIEQILSPDFRYINGRQIEKRAQFAGILQRLWQSKRWQQAPMMPYKTRYHFFSLNECMITLYYNDDNYVVNVMQELWMKNATLWEFNALSTVNR